MTSSTLRDDLQRDVAAIARIDAVPTILEVVCRTTGMGFAAVARVTEDRWIACAVRDEIQFGLKPGGELKVETTICDEIRDSGQPVVIDHVAADQDFCGHPTPAMYGFQSYISMPILRTNGAFFGTLCAIDPRPAKLKTPQTIGMFKLFADLIGFHLEAQERLASSEAALLGERQTAELARAVHRRARSRPAQSAGLHRCGRAAARQGARSTTRRRTIVALIESSVRRMAGLIDNVLDFARGRLGGGLQLEPQRRRAARSGPRAGRGGAALRLAGPADRRQDRPCPSRSIAIGARIGQLLSNLLANALTHGDGSARLGDRRGSMAERSSLSLQIAATRSRPRSCARLFEPFYRSAGDANPQGLGLGLYIASEIARAHGGTLSVASGPEETRFVLMIPAV